MSSKSLCSSSSIQSRRTKAQILMNSNWPTRSVESMLKSLERFWISVRVKGEEFIELENDEDTLTFLIDLGYKGSLHKYTNMYMDHMSQPWRTLAAIINKCLSGKTIPPKRRIGKGSQGKKTVDDSKEIVDVSEESKPEPEPFKRKTAIRRVVKKKVTIFADDNIIHDLDVAFELGISISIVESKEEEAAKQVHATHVRIMIESVPKSARKKTGSRSSRIIVIQDTPSAPKPKQSLQSISLKDDKEGDADDEGDDHISDTQDTNDEDDETKSDKDEIYTYKICVHSKKTKEEKDDSKKAKLPPTSSSLYVSSSFGDQFLKIYSNTSLIATAKDTTDAEISSLLDIKIHMMFKIFTKNCKIRKECDNNAMDKGVADLIKNHKRKHNDDDDDDDENPLAGPNQGKKTKKRRSKELESSKKPSSTKETPKGKAPSKGSKTDVVHDDDQPQDTSEPKTSKTPNQDWVKKPPWPPTLSHPCHLTVAVDYFFNNDLEYLKYSDPERTYTTLITATWLFHITNSDIVDFIVALRIFSRSLVIKKRVKDLQLGVESHQKKLNITPPQQTFLEFKFKELYTPSHKPPGGNIITYPFTLIVLYVLRRSSNEKASAAAKPHQEDSLEFYLITGRLAREEVITLAGIQEQYAYSNTLNSTGIRMFPEEVDKIEKYIGGLPDMILGSVKASRSRPANNNNNNNRNNNNQQGNGCFECGAQGHHKRNCPKLKNNDRGNQARNDRAPSRVYAVGNARANPDNVVAGTFLLNDHCASILFDTGADKSFVSTAFSSLININPSTLDYNYDVELANGQLVRVNTIIRGCTLNLLNRSFNIDLLPVELGSFDVIVGMDWLKTYHAVIVCDEKIVRVPFEDETLIIRCNESNNGNQLNIISCTKTRKYLLKGYPVFLVNITTRTIKDKSKEKQLKDVPIVRDFSEHGRLID
nr:putative reverse transcriptase domain-containing protein [Tanacetum cinerariifolium]